MLINELNPPIPDASNTLFSLSQQDSLSQQKRDCDRSTIVVTDDVAAKATDSVAVFIYLNIYTTMAKQNETVASVQNAFAEADNLCTIRVTRGVPNEKYGHLLNLVGKSNEKVLKYVYIGDDREELTVIDNSSVVSDVYIGSIIDKIVEKNPICGFLYNMLEENRNKVLFILPYISVKVAQYQLKEGIKFTSPIDGEVRIPQHDTIKNYVVDVITHQGFDQIINKMLDVILQ